MQNKIDLLICQAKHRMKRSNDPLHNLSHVTRVADYAKRFCEGMNLTSAQKEAVVLAAWWHDIARTITKKPSIVWMAAVDDTISAIMLWWATVRCGLFGTSAGVAARIILCKNIGTGAILTKFLFRKKNRILVDIVKDADSVDMLHQERRDVMMQLAETSKLYRHGYKIAIWWSIKTSEFRVKTEIARRCLKELLIAFIAWAKEKHIFEWHVQQFGLKWVEKNLRKAEELLQIFVLEEINLAKMGV